MVSESSAMPRWMKVVFSAFIIVLLILQVYLIGLAQPGFAKQDTAIDASERRDCVTTIAQARNAVFQDVDIYKAIQIEQLSSALLASQRGATVSPQDIAAYEANDLLLKESLVEARRLQPPDTLDEIVEHGGLINGKRYKRCPAVK